MSEEDMSEEDAMDVAHEICGQCSLPIITMARCKNIVAWVVKYCTKKGGDDCGNCIFGHYCGHNLYVCSVKTPMQWTKKTKSDIAKELLGCW